jgi:hypothetical protein
LITAMDPRESLQLDRCHGAAAGVAIQSQTRSGSNN